MHGPDDEFRHAIATRLDELTSEDDLYEILGRIEGAVRDDVVGDLRSEGEAYEELAAIEAWASIASDAVQTLYVPGSPNLLRRRGHNLSGWSKDAVERLRRIADALRNALRAVAGLLQAVAFTVGVSFPWGVSISITWPS